MRRKLIKGCCAGECREGILILRLSLVEVSAIKGKSREHDPGESAFKYVLYIISLKTHF